MARHEDDRSSRFGGWRDWLLVALATPVILGALVGMTALGIGSKGGGWTVPTRGEALGLLGLAIAGGLLLGRRRHRSPPVGR